MWQSVVNGLDLLNQRLPSLQTIRATRSGVFPRPTAIATITNLTLKPMEISNTDRVDNDEDGAVIQSRSFQSCLAAAVTIAACASIVNPYYPADAIAADTPTTSLVFNHEYSDPLHPLCKRKIEVNGQDGRTFRYDGTGVKSPPGEDPVVLRGCTPKEIAEFGSRKGGFDGEILPGNRITAGDGVHEGVWEPANSKSSNLGYEDKDGIRWNDGNKWVVNDRKSPEKSAGAVIAYAWLGLSAFAGVKGISDRINASQTEQ